MANSRFPCQTFMNSNFVGNNVQTNNFRFNNNSNENNRSRECFPNTIDDWNIEIDENKTNNTLPWSQFFDQKNYNSSNSRQNLTHSLNISNRISHSSVGDKVSRGYLINNNNVPRLIGKGGGTIKQIQREYDVQIKVSNDRQNQWVDLTISGSNDEAIQNAFNHIENIVGAIKEKNEYFQLHTVSNIGSSKDRSTNECSSSHLQFGKLANRRFSRMNFEDDEYTALFDSDEETSDNHQFKKDKYNTAAFPLISPWNTSNSDTTKRVDWAKMRRTNTANDMTKWKDFPPVIKEFYHELSDIAQMSIEDIQSLRAEKNNIVVSWFDSSMKDEYEQKHKCKLAIPNPIYEFTHAFHNYPEILDEITKQGFSEPSPIQCQAWPVALKGHDFIGIAQTGTGKTLAFLLPALIHISNQPPIKTAIRGPRALVLSPTRELAVQIHQEVQKYNYCNIRSAVIYGGSSRKNQISQCETGVEIIIATPGRLNDLVMNNVIDLRSITFLVLDEADRMLDMGFEPQIIKILLDIRPDRQTIMTSATWPEDVRRIAARYMRNPIQICVGALDLTAVHTVRQDIEIVKEEEKFDILLDFICRIDSEDKMIVFVDRKSSADAIASELIRKHISCQSIHGDREQSDREQALEDLKSGAVNILIATDVASRGLDIQDITVVFNYDLPKSMEDYVHRIGRTGRAGKTGYALSLVTRENWSSAGRLIKILEEAAQNVPTELRQMAEHFQTLQQRKRQFISGGNRYSKSDKDGNSRSSYFGSIHFTTRS